MATKESKIKLLREIENAAGFEKFPVNANSTHEDIDNSLSFCMGAISTLELYKHRVEDALEVEEEEDEILTYSITDESTRHN